jgi:Holliday junction resolvasome RuvABC ATP-dependent DNA helicase subunit
MSEIMPRWTPEEREILRKNHGTLRAARRYIRRVNGFICEAEKSTKHIIDDAACTRAFHRKMVEYRKKYDLWQG